MELLRNLRASTRVLFLYEVTTSRHSRLRTIAERLGMTVQGCSDYAHGLERDGLLSMVDGEYRATKKGVEFLHDRLVDLRSFVERARREMAFIETTAAIAGNTIRRGRACRREGTGTETADRVRCRPRGGRSRGTRGQCPAPRTGRACGRGRPGDRSGKREARGQDPVRERRTDLITRGSTRRRDAHRRRGLVPPRPDRNPLPGHSHR